jgi:hypothetical protein
VGCGSRRFSVLYENNHQLHVFDEDKKKEPAKIENKFAYAVQQQIVENNQVRLRFRNAHVCSVPSDESIGSDKIAPGCRSIPGCWFISIRGLSLSLASLM